MAENLEYTAVWNSAMLQTQVRVPGLCLRRLRRGAAREMCRRLGLTLTTLSGGQDIPDAFAAMKKKQKAKYGPMLPKL